MFNPWWDVDSEHEINAEGPKIRRRQLKQYLSERTSSARLLLLGEALGYQGGHFTGLAMTSERLLLGHKRSEGLEPHRIFANLQPRRTSRPEIRPAGFSEPTATIVWKSLIQNEIPTRDVVIWNAFPWHSYDGKKGMLSNRRPNRAEMRAARPLLEMFLELFRLKTIVAVGRVSHELLDENGTACTSVRHPACGGAAVFRRQLAQIAKRL